MVILGNQPEQDITEMMRLDLILKETWNI